MILRKHQAATVEACRDILAGAPITEIIESVTPGGGKSFVPVILAENLIPANIDQTRLIADRICWIVPRNSLKYQGEAEFLNPIWKTSKRIRAADNGSDLSRGYEGYVTTYQAVGANPQCHADEFTKHRYILFLDEPHHVAEGSEWHKALQPLVDQAVLVVYASGTLSRGDGEKIAFMPYKNGEIDLTNTEKRRVITYSRSEAIADGAILKVDFKLVDGAAEWEELDGTKGESALSGEESAKALFTALRTDYANQLLNECLDDFVRETEVYDQAKALVVAPNIEIAQGYYAYLAGRGLHARIATSDDTPGARKNISDYKRGTFRILVTIAMAYEGLNVPEVTHICCLTHIRSIPWLEQCFARGNRLAPGKRRAVVFAPADHNFKKAVRMIEREQLVPLSNPDDQMELGTSEEKRPEGAGESRPWIIPIGSNAALDGRSAHPALELPPCSPSDAEKYLRKNIHSIIEGYLETVGNGSKLATQQILYRRIRLQVDKKIPEMNTKELTVVWQWLKKNIEVKA